MRRALGPAREAMALGEGPVGWLVVRRGRLGAQACGLRGPLKDPAGHAERLALTVAGRTLSTGRLDDCCLYVTLEPCPMCAGAIVQGRVARIVFGTDDPKAGACRSLYRLIDDPRLNHRSAWTGGVLKEECRELLAQFFRSRRTTR